MGRMVGGDVHRAVFIGIDTVSIGWIRIENDKVFLKSRSWWDFFGWFPKWIPVLNNVRQMLDQYEERQVLDIDEGRVEDDVRVYFYDLDRLTPYASRMNPVILRKVESLQSERDYLYQLALEVKSYFERAGSHDMFKEHFKREFDFFSNNLKPGWAFNKDDDDKKRLDRR
jgi:hypothetical protein